MCKYCKEIPIKGKEDSYPCIVKDGDEYFEYYHGLDKDFFKIIYCPICGRKLSEVSE